MQNILPEIHNSSLEEENELIKRFLLTLEAEIEQNPLSIQSFQDSTGEFITDFPQILETCFQNLYVRENYINILVSIISKPINIYIYIYEYVDHVFERDTSVMSEKQKSNEALTHQLDQLKESLEIALRRSNDLENAYEREEKTKNELFDELGTLENTSNQIKDLLNNAKVEIMDYQDMINSYKVLSISIYNQYILYL